jgi:hypothetical protein
MPVLLGLLLEQKEGTVRVAELLLLERLGRFCHACVCVCVYIYIYIYIYINEVVQQNDEDDFELNEDPEVMTIEKGYELLNRQQEIDYVASLNKEQRTRILQHTKIHTYTCLPLPKPHAGWV